MAKKKKVTEWVLNPATNRYKLNQSNNVGSVSEKIRKCAPKTEDEWRNYYFRCVRRKKKLVDLGKQLYEKVQNNLIPEINAITEDDCVNYIINLVITKTYEGYVREKETIYGVLQKEFDETIQEAPDDWDRRYNVDYYIKIGECYIGLQVKPYASTPTLPQINKERLIQQTTHDEFENIYGGKVFFVFSYKIDKRTRKKIIYGKEDLIKKVKNEINRLKTLQSL